MKRTGAGKISFRLLTPFLAVTLAVLQGCTDLGSAPPSTAPVISNVSPPSAAPGDTLTIVGKQFGDPQGSSVVRIGGVIADSVIAWSSSVIKVRIPSASSDGTVVVSVDGSASNPVTFQLHQAVAVVSFATDILPIFNQHGCYTCHGGSGGLVVHTVADLLRGGLHGPAVTPGNAGSSLIIQKLSPNPPFGSQMPQGGPYLDSTTIAVIATWINQGALNN